ncbi:MAG: hypothetical protein JWP81_4428 [Ferruginibacter sp.]|nr:hypothetical protein [Ferruginibacter sp.]
MPVKITTSPSDPKSGVINKAEMDEALRKFEYEISISTLKGDYTAIKTNACSFAREEILLLLGIDPASPSSGNIEGLSIHFGVHPAGQLSCKNEDLSYRINTMLFAYDDNLTDLKEVNDLMLIPGYKVSTISGDAPACCGSMSGGNTKVPVNP